MHRCSWARRTVLSIATKKLARSIFRYHAGSCQFSVTDRTMRSSCWAAYRVPRPGMQAQLVWMNEASMRGATAL